MTLAKTKITKTSGLKRTTIFLNAGQHEELRKMAFEKRTSMANLIRAAVLEMLEDEEDVKSIQEAEKAGNQEYVPWEDVKRQWKENHKNG